MITRLPSRIWLSQLQDEIRNGYVRTARHPELPLTIYNYTVQAQFAGHWNDVTKRCRGLVLDDNHKIVIAPPEKFFNVGEPYAPKLDLAHCDLTYKADGYYIAVKQSAQYGLIVTSRGSFTNQYVAAARTLLPADLRAQYTYFFELLQDFPGDEGIIVARHPVPQLVLWCLQDPSGAELPIEVANLPHVQHIPFAQMKDFLSGKDEGLVARDPLTNQRVKLKTEYYLRLHRLISNCTKLRVWEILSQGQKLTDHDFPDEYMPQLLQWEDELQSDFHSTMDYATAQFFDTTQLSDKELAQSDLPQPWKAYVFLLRKGKRQELYDLIWRNLRPKNGIIDTKPSGSYRSSDNPSTMKRRTN